ncbi:putative ribonuclease H-like domain-containing protein [Tanacetum coccineum]
MLADSLLPTTFWAEAVSTACYVQNRVLVTKPHNKTPYELLHGRPPSISFMRPFGCLVTILNTLDPLSKFDGKADEGFDNADDLPTDPLMPDLEDTADLLDTGSNGTYDDEDEGAEADLNNLKTTMNVSPIPTTRIHKDHPKNQIIGDINSATQTRRMTKISEEHALVSYINKQRRTNHKDYQNCLFAYFLSQKKPKKVIQTLDDPIWIEVMQEELLQFKLQKVWTLVDLPNGKRAIGTKWVFRNKKDERGIVVRNNARLVAQGYTQEEGIDYDECKVEVDDINLGSIKKSLCVEFKQMMNKRFQISSMGELTFFLGLQVKQKDDGIFISQDKYVADILKKFDFATVKTASTPIETNKALLKDEEAEDVDVHLYRSMIGSLMYLTASRPDIIFPVCACVRFQVTPKVSHLNAMKRIFRYLKGQPKLGLWYWNGYLTKGRKNQSKRDKTGHGMEKFQVTPKVSHLNAMKKIFRYLKGQPKLGLWYPRDSPFDLEAFSDSDYAGAILDRKSTTELSNFLAKGVVDSKSNA